MLAVVFKKIKHAQRISATIWVEFQRESPNLTRSENKYDDYEMDSVEWQIYSILDCLL